ncbi:unnamed protein product, partial [Symbiodinium pilosum]
MHGDRASPGPGMGSFVCPPMLVPGQTMVAGGPAFAPALNPQTFQQQLSQGTLPPGTAPRGRTKRKVAETPAPAAGLNLQAVQALPQMTQMLPGNPAISQTQPVPAPAPAGKAKSDVIQGTHMKHLDEDDSHVVLNAIDDEQFNEIVLKEWNLTEKLDLGRDMIGTLTSRWAE